MVRIVLGVIVGFIVWLIVWIGGQSLMEALSPEWIAKHYRAAEAAFASGDRYAGDSTIEIINSHSKFYHDDHLRLHGRTRRW